MKMRKKSINRKNTAFEFFFDDSFEDYKVPTQPLIDKYRAVLLRTARNFNWRYFFKVLVTINLLVMLFTKHEILQFGVVNGAFFIFLFVSFLIHIGVLPEPPSE